MYPADTLEQARVFYNRPSAVEQAIILENEQEGWTIRPNFHFGFMAKGFDWTNTNLPLAEYLRYWQQNIQNTRQVRREDWSAYWDELLKAKIAEPADREQFDRDFTSTDRPSAAPRPGISCTFAWKLDEAERFDARGQLANAVRTASTNSLKPSAKIKSIEHKGAGALG